MAGQLGRSLPGPPSGDSGSVLVVGHDRFPESDHALAVAARLAQRVRAFVHVVHAVCLDDYPIDPDADDWELRAVAVLDVQRHTVERLLTGIVSGWSYEVGRGDPGELLAAAAEAHDALMIVVGTRGGGLAPTLARLVDPSVSRWVTLHQRRPVLVVPLWRETSLPPSTAAQADRRS